MTQLTLKLLQARTRLGLKGPRAAEWLGAHGITLPAAPNSWTVSEEPPPSEGLLVAKLGSAEFFLEGAARDGAIERLAAALEQGPAGVYPVAREDCGFDLGGEGVHEMLAQVCNVHFAALAQEQRPVIMTLMVGVAVLIVPRDAGEFRIWCDPTFGAYLGASLGGVVKDCGGSYTGVS